MKPIKIPKLSDYHAELWRVFSLYIRQRDADENGIIRCISCGKPMSWRHSDAGHYYSRTFSGIKYHEKNVNAQCKQCNFRQGNAQGYKKGLVAKYGEDVLDHLDLVKHNKSKYTRFELQALTDFYLQKLIDNGWAIR
jgi:hypothetical protein